MIASAADALTAMVWPWLAGATLQMAALALLASLFARRSPAWLAVLIAPFIPALFSPEHTVAAVSALRWQAPEDWNASNSIRIAAVAVWAAGAVFALALVVRRARGARAAWLADSAPALGVIADQASVAARLLGLRRVPAVVIRSPSTRFARSGQGPAVVGIFRPVIVVPKWLERSSIEDVRHVLLHEMAHVVRHDPLAAALCVAIQAVFWFHPAAWLARVRLGVLREIACDARAASVCDRAAYRRTLARMAAPLANASPAGALALFSDAGALVTRLHILEHAAPRRPAVRSALAAAALVTLVACSTPIRHAAVAAVPEVPEFSELKGSMQKRFAVYAMLAREQAK